MGSVVILWGAFIAPRARHRLRDPLRFAAESIVWVGAIAALIGVRHVAAAIGFGVVAFGAAIATRRYESVVTRRGDGG